MVSMAKYSPRSGGSDAFVRVSLGLAQLPEDRAAATVACAHDDLVERKRELVARTGRPTRRAGAARFPGSEQFPSLGEGGA